jgi:hypothetical protein
MNILIRNVSDSILAALDADAARKRQSRQDKLLDLLNQHYGDPPVVMCWLKSDRNGELNLSGSEEPDVCAECGQDLDAVWIGILSDSSLHMPVCSGCAHSD